MKVGCDIPGCQQRFELTPDSIIQVRSVDDNDEEIKWMPREYLFICPACEERFAVEVEEDEDSD